MSPTSNKVWCNYSLMPQNTKRTDRDHGTKSSRRRFIQMTGAVGFISGIAGCMGSPQGGGDAQEGQGGSGGGNGSSGGKTTIEVAASSAEKENLAGVNKALHQGGLPSNIEVSILSSTGLSGDTQSQFRQWLSAGRAKPDIFRMDVGWTIPFIKRDQIVDLGSKLPKDKTNEIKNNYFPASVDATSGENGNIYGIPYQVGFPTISYRKDLVKKAGFKPDEEEWATNPLSWKKFSKVVGETKKQSGTKFGYAWQAKNYAGLSCCSFNELMTSWGGAYFGGFDNLFGPVGERPVTVDSEPVLQALRMARSFIHGSDEDNTLQGYQGISPTNVLQWSEGPSLSTFTDGNAVALRYWPSAIPPAQEAFGDDLGVMPIPYGVTEDNAEFEGTGGTASALGGWNMTLNPNSNNQDAALKVLEAFTSDSYRQFQLEELALLPPDSAQLNSDAMEDIAIWGEYADTLDIGGKNAVPRPVTVVWPDESPAIAERVNAVLAGQQSPEEGMSTLKKTLEDLEGSA